MPIYVQIADPLWRPLIKQPKAWARKIFGAVLEDVSQVCNACELSVLLTNDAHMQELNKAFRGKDYPTNVLAFPGGAETYLGDIALAFGVCARESAEQGKPLLHHVTHLLAHGLLHLWGYTHGEPEEAAVMESLEKKILNRLQIPDPYGEQGACLS